MTESGIAGSIGVVMVHYDVSERASKMGVKATVITAGKNKATGHPYGPLDDESHKQLKAKVDRVMAGFVKLVADHRPGLTPAKVRALEADTFIGEDAVKAGLADRVDTFESVVRQLSDSGAASAPRRLTTAMAEAAMPAPVADAGEFMPLAEHERLVAAARDEGYAAGRAEGLASSREEGAREERERIAGILGDPSAKGREPLRSFSPSRPTLRFKKPSPF